MTKWSFLLALFLSIPVAGFAQTEIIEISCPSCGYGNRFLQGATPADQARNIQNVIVVCERTREIRNVRIPLNPNAAVEGEPLLARPNGMATSKILGMRLPHFLIPGNTCPLFPITAYLQANICPIDGQPGIRYGIAESY